LLLKNGANINVTDCIGSTALYQAILHSHKDKASNDAKSVIDVLLEYKADVNSADVDNQTPLCRAAYCGMLDIVGKMLHSYGRKPNKGSPLSSACYQQNVEVVDMLLNHGANPNPVPTSYYNPSLPLLVAADKDNGEAVEMLLKCGAKMDVTDSDGNTALHRAIEGCYKSSRQSHEVMASSNLKSAVDVLLENKADVNIENNSGETPLCRAARRGFADIVRKMLLEYKGNPNKGSPLAVACRKQNVAVVDDV